MVAHRRRPAPSGEAPASLRPLGGIRQRPIAASTNAAARVAVHRRRGGLARRLLLEPLQLGLGRCSFLAAASSGLRVLAASSSASASRSCFLPVLPVVDAASIRRAEQERVQDHPRDQRQQSAWPALWRQRRRRSPPSGIVSHQPRLVHGAIVAGNRWVGPVTNCSRAAGGPLGRRDGRRCLLLGQRRGRAPQLRPRSSRPHHDATKRWHFWWQRADRH
jgi:hypothetical protein